MSNKDLDLRKLGPFTGLDFMDEEVSSVTDALIAAIESGVT